MPLCCQAPGGEAGARATRPLAHLQDTEEAISPGDRCYSSGDNIHSEQGSLCVPTPFAEASG